MDFGVVGGFVSVGGVAGSRESMPAPAASRASAQTAAAISDGSWSPVLDPDVAVVPGMARPLLFVTPATVLRWHRHGWKAYWHWRSRRGRPRARKPVPQEVRDLIRRMAGENRLWGQKRIQAELARLGYSVSARTVARYMRSMGCGPASPGWRTFLSTHAREIWACDFSCVQTLLFRTICVFFVIHHVRREVVHVHITTHPTAGRTGRQIVEACGWDREPPRSERLRRLLQSLAAASRACTTGSLWSSAAADISQRQRQTHHLTPGARRSASYYERAA